jgi:hypothetical protein
MTNLSLQSSFVIVRCKELAGGVKFVWTQFKWERTKDTWSLLLSSVSLRVCYFLSSDWANCFTLKHNRRPIDVCFAFISPQMASVLIIVSGLTIVHIHLALSQYVVQTYNTYTVSEPTNFFFLFSCPLFSKVNRSSGGQKEE